MTKELYIDSIAFSYREGQQLLTGVHLQCKVGDVIGLLGRNGCGKSTLMQIIFGTIKAKVAFIRLNGIRREKLYTTKDICYLPQQRFLPTAKTVSQMASLMLFDPLQIQRLQEDEVIQPIWHNKIADLSGGELRYLEIMLLILQPATFILLDEPFSGVSPYLKERIQELILSYKDQKGFVISDHHYQSVLDITTSILLLQNGGCRQIQSKQDLEYFYVPEGTFDE